MPDRPIIYSAAMVLGLLAGRKTMTRRLATSPLRKCATGDRLWVRETCIVGKGVGGYAAGVNPDTNPDGATIDAIFRADPENAAIQGPWRPSIHMPRWASRLTLTVTAVKIERLHEISEDDARAEGVQLHADQESGRGLINVGARFCALDYVAPRGVDETPDDVLRRAWTFRAHFAALWDTLHGPDAWKANPEIVAISFTVEQRNIDAQPALELANG